MPGIAFPTISRTNSRQDNIFNGVICAVAVAMVVWAIIIGVTSPSRSEIAKEQFGLTENREYAVTVDNIDTITTDGSILEDASFKKMVTLSIELNSGRIEPLSIPLDQISFELNEGGTTASFDFSDMNKPMLTLQSLQDLVDQDRFMRVTISTTRADYAQLMG